MLHGTGSLKFSEGVRLNMKFPNTDWTKCYLLQHGKAPPTPKETYLNIGVGIALILSGGPIYYFAWRLWRATRKC